MRRDCKVYLEDILTAAEKIREYTAGLRPEEWAADSRTLDAVVRNLEIVGEAAKNVPEDVRAAHPQVDWKRIAGLRDVLIHQYFGIDIEVISDIVRHKLPALVEQVERILGR